MRFVGAFWDAGGMEAAGLWVSVVAACAGIAAAVFAYVQAKAATDSRADAEQARRDAQVAQQRAEEARAEALRVAAEARDALGRSAAALEAANEISERALPKPQIKWNITQIGDSRWMAQNVGDLTAFDAEIEKLAGWLHTDDDGPRDVTRGDCLYFNTMSIGGESARIRIVCEDRSGDEPLRTVNEITMP